MRRWGAGRGGGLWQLLAHGVCQHRGQKLYGRNVDTGGWGSTVRVFIEMQLKEGWMYECHLVWERVLRLPQSPSDHPMRSDTELSRGLARYDTATGKRKGACLRKSLDRVQSDYTGVRCGLSG